MPSTTNHLVNLPTVGADADQWGGENNDAHQAWDTLTSGGQNTVLGRVAASSGPYTQLTATQLTTIPNAVVGDSGAGGTKGMVPAPAAGDTAAGKVLTAAGTWGSEIKARGVFTGSTGALVAGRNVTLSRTGAGQYTATLSPALANANYEVQVTCQTSADAMLGYVLPTGKTTTEFRITTVVIQNGGNVAALDPAQLYVMVTA